ncbi:MAG: hypothetical protein ACX94D_03665 [Henriciella sp.]
MSDQNLPKDAAPLSPFEYWQESLKTWMDFSQQTAQIVTNQMSGPARGKQPMDADSETLSGELLRTYSDMNLRHWQNTARFLEGLPGWMRVPHNMTGSALVDWFDKVQRQSGLAGSMQSSTVEPATPVTETAPEMLPAPVGPADDLTRIKGIGPKLSERLNNLGIYHFKQIAAWTKTEAQWVDEYLAFKGRVGREKWIKQARALTANGSTLVH